MTRAAADRRCVKATLILLPLLGVTWVFGFLSLGSPATLVFTYLFTICNTLQGTFFFIFHCLLNPDVSLPLPSMSVLCVSGHAYTIT